MFKTFQDMAREIYRRNMLPNQGLNEPRPWDENPNLEMDEDYNSVIKPQTGMFDQMIGMIRNRPQRNPNPSGWDDIKGALAGAGASISPQAIVGGQPIGIKYDPKMYKDTNNYFRDPKYYDGMDDLSDNMKIMEPGVKAEETANNNRRLMWDSIQNRKIQKQNADRLVDAQNETARKNAELEKDRDLDRDIKERLAQAKIWLAEHPDWKTTTDKSGKLVFYNPKTKETQVSDIDTGKMSDMDKLTTRHTQTMEEIAARGDESRETKTTIPGKAASGSGTGTMSPSQKAVDIQNKLKEAKETHPEWGNLITLDPNTKKLGIGASSTADPKALNALFKFVYGEERVHMKDPQGKGMWVAKSQAEYAKSKGFTMFDGGK